MKQLFNWLLKAMIAGIAAFLCISLFCYFFYNHPAHRAVVSGATDHAWKAFHFTSRGTEGFAYTKTDENGYVNTYPNKKDTVDILLMGSSHTEGFNVNYNQNYAYLLNKKLDVNGFDLYAYNIGISKHTFGRCLNNLESALDSYPSPRYVVIETHSASIDMVFMQQLLSDTYEPMPSHSSGLVSFLQGFDFLRLGYYQIKQMRNNKASVVPAEKTLPEQYASTLDQVIEKANHIAQAHGCTLIILYSPTLSIDYNGDIIPPSYSEEFSLLERSCQAHGVVLINAQTSYENIYTETNHLPHGFINTAVGKGHMNQYGHAAVADLLFDYITKEDA